MLQTNEHANAQINKQTNYNIKLRSDTFHYKRTECNTNGHCKGVQFKNVTF